jgi:hypothetical protein
MGDHHRTAATDPASLHIRRFTEFWEPIISMNQQSVLSQSSHQTGRGLNMNPRRSSATDMGRAYTAPPSPDGWWALGTCNRLQVPYEITQLGTR